MKRLKLHQLVAAAHTPFKPDGSLNLKAVEKQAAHFLENDLTITFICGSTGESHSLNADERRQLAERWMDVTRGTRIKVIVHVGSNCLEDSRALATHAAEIGATAIAAQAPSYFKPRNVSALVDTCARIAGGAPGLPFYYYDIPSMTGVSMCMPDFLSAGRERIPNLAGIKWTNPDLYSYQLCLHMPGDFDLPWGNDEFMLAALALGAKGAVGSTFNFAAPLYHRLIKAFTAGNLNTARREQYRSCLLVKTLVGTPTGYMAAAKEVMAILGVDVGGVRAPLPNLTTHQKKTLRNDLKKIGFFDWI